MIYIRTFLQFLDDVDEDVEEVGVDAAQLADDEDVSRRFADVDDAQQLADVVSLKREIKFTTAKRPSLAEPKRSIKAAPKSTETGNPENNSRLRTDADPRNQIRVEGAKFHNFCQTLNLDSDVFASNCGNCWHQSSWIFKYSGCQL